MFCLRCGFKTSFVVTKCAVCGLSTFNLEIEDYKQSSGIYKNRVNFYNLLHGMSATKEHDRSAYKSTLLGPHPDSIFVDEVEHKNRKERRKN